MNIAYVIKRDNLYKTTNSRQWTKNIKVAKFFDSYELAERYIYNCYLRIQPNVKVVEVEIREVEDE